MDEKPSKVYQVGQDGVNTIYKALKMLLKNTYSELDITHIDRQTARAIVNEIEKARGSETESKTEVD